MQQALNIERPLLPPHQAQYTNFYMSSFERHHTRSSQGRSLCSKLFVLFCVNSAVLQLAANMYVPHWHSTNASFSFKGAFFNVRPKAHPCSVHPRLSARDAAGRQPVCAALAHLSLVYSS